jgi:1,4-dihydroxy-2-naphthoyl-CoA hydrolase
MDPETATPATRTAVTPRLEVSLEDSGPFLRAAGLIFDEISATRVTGHLELGPEHHTPWGVVHGGVYTAAVETAAPSSAS